MKKITKFMITLSTFFALAGTTFAIVNNKVDSDNKDHVNEVYKQKQQNENELADVVNTRFAQKEEYKRNEILNNAKFDIDKLDFDINFLQNREGYINTESYRFYSNYNNIKTNKNLTVYIDSSVPSNERKLIADGVAYLNTIYHTINPELSIKITSQKQNSNSCICIYNSNETPRGSYGGTTLAETRSYEYGSNEYNGPINIYMYTGQISKLYGYNEDVYSQYYKSVFMHEISHAFGIDHCNMSIEMDSKNKDELSRPLMLSGIASSNPKDFYTASEIAEIFAWINKEKYSSATKNGTISQELKSDFEKYINLIDYSLNQSKVYNSYSTAKNTIKSNQVFEISYNDKIYDSNTNAKKNASVKITFNYPCQNMYQKEVTFEDGSKTTSTAPYFYSKDSDGNGKYSLLSSDCKTFDLSNIYNNNLETYNYKNNLSYDEIVKLMENFDSKNGYTIKEDSSVFYEFSVETQNLWEKIFNKSTNNTFYIKSPTFSVDYKYSWSIGSEYNHINAEETTNYISEKTLISSTTYENENVIERE